MHKQIIENLTSSYKSEESIFALLVTGSVVRGEQSDNSDLDLLLISKEKRPFEERQIDGIVVEIKSNTADGFIQKMKDESMNVYQWLDAKVIFDKNNSAEIVIDEAKKVYENYTPDSKEIAGVIKWLESAKLKIESFQANNDKLALGFNVSNILWQVVRGLYVLNNKPVPPSTTAFRRINALEKLPKEFNDLWNSTTTGDLEKRASATLKLIGYIISQIENEAKSSKTKKYSVI